jgi:hypothetical protein
MCMKTQETPTSCHGKNTPFSKKKCQLRGDLRKSSRLVPRNSNDHAINQSALAPPFKPSPRIEIG